MSHASAWTRGDISVSNDFSSIRGKVLLLDQSLCRWLYRTSCFSGSPLLTFSLNDQVDYIIHLAAAISVAESMSDPGFWNFVIFISSFDGRI